MAVYVEKWDGDNPGDPPSDWSAVLGTSNISAEIVETAPFMGLDRALELNSSTSNIRVWKWDVPGNQSDIDFLVRFEIPDWSAGENVEIWIRGSGTSAATIEGYVLQVHVEDSSTARITFYVQSGTMRTQLSQSLYDLGDAALPMWIRIFAKGNGIGWDFARDGFFPYAGSADIVVTDNTYSSGWVGIGTSSTGVKFIHPLSLATGTDTAVLPIGEPPEEDVEPGQFAFSFEGDAPGQPPSGLVIDAWDFVEDEPLPVLVTDEKTLRAVGREAYVILLPDDERFENLVRMEVFQKFRLSSPDGNWFDLLAGVFGEIHDVYAGVYSETNWGSVRYLYGLSRFADDYDGENDEPTQLPLEEDVWYYLHTKFDGSDLYLSMWKDGDDPPEDWQLHVTDEAVPFFPGFAAITGSLYTLDEEPVVLEWDYIGIGIGGAPAPMPGAEPTELGGRSSTGTLAAASLDTQLSLSGRSASGARGEADVDTGVRLAGRSGTVTRAAAEVNSAIRLAGRSPTATRVDASVASRASLSGQSATPTRAQGAVRTGVILSGRSAAAPRAHAALDATVEFGGRSATATRARGDLRVPDATRLSGRSRTAVRASAVVLAPLALSGRSATVTRAAGRLVVDMVPPIVEEGIAVITRHHAVGAAMVRRQEALASITRVQEREARI